MIPQQKALFPGVQTVAFGVRVGHLDSHDEKLLVSSLTLEKKKKNRNVLQLDSPPCFGMCLINKKMGPQKSHPIRTEASKLPPKAKPSGGSTVWVWPVHSALSNGQQKNGGFQLGGNGKECSLVELKASTHQLV